MFISRGLSSRSGRLTISLYDPAALRRWMPQKGVEERHPVAYVVPLSQKTDGADERPPQHGTLSQPRTDPGVSGYGKQ
jgi:hypothetical protein